MTFGVGNSGIIDKIIGYLLSTGTFNDSQVSRHLFVGKNVHHSPVSFAFWVLLGPSKSCKNWRLSAEACFAEAALSGREMNSEEYLLREEVRWIPFSLENC